MSPTSAPAVVDQGVLPAPAWRRAGDLVFVSTIHPLTADGRLAAAERPSPWVGESDVAAQTRAVLQTLEAVLREAGSAPELVLRTEVQLADAADFVEFKLAYASVFAEDPPARTTIVVGDEHLIAGARLTLHAVALAADAQSVRRTVTSPELLASEHCALAAATGPFVFCSGLTASDHRTGLAVRSPRGAYHGSDAQMQAAYVIDELERVLQQVGSGLEHGLKVQFYEPDLRTFPIVDREWGERVGVPPTRSSMACRDLLVPDAVWAANLTALVPGQGLEKQETRAGIRWHPVDARRANFSPGIVAGDWLFTAGQIPVADIAHHEDWVGAPEGLPHHFSDIEIQTDFTLQLLREQLAGNGFGFEHVVDARVYLVDPRRDLRGFARAWERAFPVTQPRPALSIIPSTQRDGSSGVMVEGPVIEIDLTSWRGTG